MQEVVGVAFCAAWFTVVFCLEFKLLKVFPSDSAIKSSFEKQFPDE